MRTWWEVLSEAWVVWLQVNSVHSQDTAGHGVPSEKGSLSWNPKEETKNQWSAFLTRLLSFQSWGKKPKVFVYPLCPKVPLKTRLFGFRITEFYRRRPWWPLVTFTISGKLACVIIHWAHVLQLTHDEWRKEIWNQEACPRWGKVGVTFAPTANWRALKKGEFLVGLFWWQVNRTWTPTGKNKRKPFLDSRNRSPAVDLELEALLDLDPWTVSLGTQSFDLSLFSFVWVLLSIRLPFVWKRYCKAAPELNGS